MRAWRNLHRSRVPVTPDDLQICIERCEKALWSIGNNAVWVNAVEINLVLGTLGRVSELLDLRDRGPRFRCITSNEAEHLLQALSTERTCLSSCMMQCSDTSCDYKAVDACAARMVFEDASVAKPVRCPGQWPAHLEAAASTACHALCITELLL